MTAQRGVRGATTVDADTAMEIHTAVVELCGHMLEANQIDAQDIAAVFFTTTDDINSLFPAEAARSLNWGMVPMIGATEMINPNGLKRCIRVLILWNTDTLQSAVRHTYIRGAVHLRPDLATPDSLG